MTWIAEIFARSSVSPVGSNSNHPVTKAPAIAATIPATAEIQPNGHFISLDSLRRCASIHRCVVATRPQQLPGQLSYLRQIDPVAW